MKLRKFNSKTHTALAQLGNGNGNGNGSSGALAPLIMSAALFGFAATLLTSVPASADVTEGQLEVSPFVGHHIFESKQNLDDGLTYGIRLSYSFTPNWAVEGAVSTVSSGVDDASVSGSREGQFRSPIDDVDLTLYQVDALYHFRPDNKFSPYIVGGLGLADYSPSISNRDMTTFNLGAGVKYWVNDKLALRFDLRDHLVGEVFADSYNNLSATVGVSFAFGGTAKSEPNQAQAPKPVKPAPVKAESTVAAEEIVLEFEDIHFDFDTATLTAEARTILQRSIATLRNNPKSKVRIAGYTSAAGTAEHNQGLSERRANAIKDYLVKEGDITARRLSVIGYGDTRPGSHEASPGTLRSTAAKENMRALFEIIVE